MPRRQTMEIDRFRRAARQHLRIARRLANYGERVVASEEAYHAIYLGGYAVECGLKALYLSRIQPRDHDRVIRGRFVEIGHNLEGLYHSVHAQFGLTMPPELRDVFRKRIAPWVIGMRYEAGHRRKREADEFLDAVEAILGWIDERC